LDDISKVSLKLSNLNLTPLLEISFELTGEHIIMITKDDFASYNLLSDCHSRHRQYGTKKYLRKTPDAQSIIDFHKTFKSVNELFISETDENSFIVKALTDFINIHMISDNSPFKLLSYISIIESLITYQPKNNADTIISKQLGQKVQFLYNNFMENLSFETYFKGANTNTISTIINKIYTYRNDIAHGNIPQMNKELKIIQLNEVNVIPFLDALLRKILRIAITNPNLIIDLKAC
jgi:hypothetical protein